MFHPCPPPQNTLLATLPRLNSSQRAVQQRWFQWNRFTKVIEYRFVHQQPSDAGRHEAHDRAGKERPERDRRDDVALIGSHRTERSNHDAHRAGIGKATHGIGRDGG